MNTTLNKIFNKSPYHELWQKLLLGLGKTEPDDEPLSILAVLNSNGLEDAMWCLRTVDGHDREIRLYAIWCTRQVQYLITDPNCSASLDLTERYAKGEITEQEWWGTKNMDGAWTSGDAVWGAVRCANEAAWIAGEAARLAARATERLKQEEQLRIICGQPGRIQWTS